MIYVAAYANGYLQKLRASADETKEIRPQSDFWDPGELYGVRDLVRVAIALGAIAAYAGLLTLVAQ